MELVTSTDRRAAARRSVLLMARCGARQVRVRNVSDTGCSIDGTDPLPPGLSITVERGDHRVRGEVVWSHADRSGLRFDGVVDPAAFGRIEPSTWAAQRRLGFVRGRD